MASTQNLWDNLPQPFYALAPMAGYTDSVFRGLCRRAGADIVYSELASATALSFKPEPTFDLIRFDAEDRPYIVQLFGNDPAHFAAAARLVSAEIRPDGIDINLGCPVPKVVKQGGGVALFQDLQRAREVIKSVLGNTELPVSVKMRARAGAMDALMFLDGIKDLDIKAVMIHGRAANAGYSGPVDSVIIREARSYFGGIVIANGGVTDPESARVLLESSGADGIGVGQGALGRPWLFASLKSGNMIVKERPEIYAAMLAHARLVEPLGGRAAITALRSHLCLYVKGLPEARRLREKLVYVETVKDIEVILS